MYVKYRVVRIQVDAGLYPCRQQYENRNAFVTRKNAYYPYSTMTARLAHPGHELRRATQEAGGVVERAAVITARKLLICWQMSIDDGTVARISPRETPHVQKIPLRV